MLTQNESELLSAYADNELMGEELVDVQKRLSVSVEWREELESLQKTKLMSQVLPRVAAPADLFDFLEDETRKHLERERFRIWKVFTLAQPAQKWAWGTSMALAASVVIVVGVYHVHQQSFIPLEPLVAAHNHSAAHGPLYQSVVDASNYTSQLKKHEQS